MSSDFCINIYMTIHERYKDLDLNFIAHPVTGDIVKKTGSDAVVQSVKNLVLTEFYDKPFHPEIGCQVHGILFENMSSITAGSIRDSIWRVITNFEPRAEVVTLTVNADFVNKGYIVVLKIKVLGTIDPVTVAFFLQKTR